MTPEEIARINELAKKKKTEGLTPEEAVEQAKLREEYIEGYRRSVRHHIEGIKVVDEEGNDVTPENYVKYNVKKVCMAVALMILNHNNDEQRVWNFSKPLF